MGYYSVPAVNRGCKTNSYKIRQADMKEKPRAFVWNCYLKKKKFKSPSKWEDGNVFHYIKG